MPLCAMSWTGFSCLPAEGPGDLGPLVSRVVAVRAVHLPAGAGQRARLVEQDTDLNTGHTVAVEDHVAASSLDPGRPKTPPDLSQELAPQRLELRPGRCGGNHHGPSGRDVCARDLLVHPQSPHVSRASQAVQSQGCRRAPGCTVAHAMGVHFEGIHSWPSVERCCERRPPGSRERCGRGTLPFPGATWASGEVWWAANTKRTAISMILPKVRDPRFVTIRRGGTLTDVDHHLLALWAAVCAENVLDLFESVRPGDPRPREAIEHARAWGRGEVAMMQARAAGGNAMGAARDLRGPARFAAYAAGQAGAVAHVAAHELGAATYALKAVRAAAPQGQAEVAGRLECHWQREQLPDTIRDLVLDDQRLRNDICWSVFDC